MSGVKDRVENIGHSMGPRGAFRLIVMLAFAGAVGYFLGSAASPVMDFLYHRVANLDKSPPDTGLQTVAFSLLGAMVGGWLGLHAFGFLENLTARWDKMEQGDKVTAFIGVFAGLIASVPLLQLTQALSLTNQARTVIISAVIVGFSSLSIYALQSMAEILPWNRNRARTRRSGVKILDTNVIIDGRIYDVAKSGFLEGPMYVPGFVLDELQYIADSHDGLRRQRGRRGLEILRHMQNEFPMEIRIYDKLVPDGDDPVDSRLVRLAKAMGADIVTNDSNLNSVARLQDVKILSLNELALTLRPNVLPQETLELSIIREGNQPGQGVGYLEDGTMVVVENGKPHIGQTLEVTVTQVIQTERGKMIFAEVDTEEVRFDAGRARRPVTRRNQS